MNLFYIFVLLMINNRINTDGYGWLVVFLITSLSSSYITTIVITIIVIITMCFFIDFVLLCSVLGEVEKLYQTSVSELQHVQLREEEVTLFKTRLCDQLHLLVEDSNRYVQKTVRMSVTLHLYLFNCFYLLYFIVCVFLHSYYDYFNCLLYIFFVNYCQHCCNSFFIMMVMTLIKK